MKKKWAYVFFILLVLAAIALLVEYIRHNNIAVLNPKGMIAIKQRNLLVISTLLMLIVALPVFFFAFVFAWKYRANNKKNKYDPHWDHSRTIETIWWAVPCAIILFLSIMAWKSSHELDPFKPLAGDVEPIKIQAIALQWKWLFLYPDHKIATLNFVEFPEQTPVNFEITADAPMNSLWIPDLGGQVYAMSGMKTKLHLIANEMGNFRGSSANLSGKGFSGMHFIAKATGLEDFNQWVESIRNSSNGLDFEEYQKLAKPSENHPVTTYILKKEDLFDRIIMKYMTPPINEKQE